MTEQLSYTATLTFDEHAAHCTSIGSLPWDPDYDKSDFTVFFIEMAGKRDITLFADSVEDATRKIEFVAKRLGALEVENIRHKVYPTPDES